MLPAERAKLFLESYLQNEKVEVNVRRRVLHTAVAARPELDALKRFFERRTRAAAVPQDPNIIYVTQESYDRKSAELTDLLERKRWADAAALTRAAAHGDLRENPEYQAARDESAKTTQRLQELQAALTKVRILTAGDVSTHAVGVGTKIKIQEMGGAEASYTVLGPWEADEAKNILSYQSPLIRQLLGRKAGETVKVDLPDGSHRDFSVLSIERAL